MILTNTRLTPPWLPSVDLYLNTFLVKAIRVYLTPEDAPAPGVLNVQLAREFLYTAPSVVWAPEEG
jgi:hypothetical protein